MSDEMRTAPDELDDNLGPHVLEQVLYVLPDEGVVVYCPPAALSQLSGVIYLIFFS